MSSLVTEMFNLRSLWLSRKDYKAEDLHKFSFLQQKLHSTQINFNRNVKTKLWLKHCISLQTASP